MRDLKRLLVGGGLVAGLAVVTAACSMEGTAPDGHQGAGTVGLELQLAPGVSVNTVNWVVTNPSSGFNRSGSVNVQFSNTLRFRLGGLPAAGGYSIALSALSTDGVFTCEGAADFAVMTAMTSSAAVSLVCRAGVGGAGSVVITGTTTVCASITSISVLPLETTVNNPIALSATASAGSTVPTFSWSATAGTFDNAASAAPVFTCPATPGEVTITLAVSPSAPACLSTSTQSIVVTCGTLNPTFTNVYSHVIGMRCTSCHRPGGGGVSVGMLDLSTPATAYATLVNVPGAGVGAGVSGVTCASLSPAMLRVSPGSSAASLLYNKVNAKLSALPPPCGSPMPTPAAAAPLTQAQVNLIRDWIDAGALND